MFLFAVLVNCVSPGSVEIIRSVIALCFVAIAFSLTAFLLDLAGPSGSIYRILHRNAVFSILTGDGMFKIIKIRAKEMSYFEVVLLSIQLTGTFKVYYCAKSIYVLSFARLNVPT